MIDEKCEKHGIPLEREECEKCNGDGTLDIECSVLCDACDGDGSVLICPICQEEDAAEAEWQEYQDAMAGQAEAEAMAQAEAEWRDEQEQNARDEYDHQGGPEE